MEQDIQITQSNYQMSAAIDQLATALAAAQGEMESAKKNSDNPFFKSKYSDLAEVIDAIKAPLAKYGLAYLQPTFMTPDGKPGVTTILAHKSGQWISSSLVINSADNKAQSQGSALTYARRYSLQSIVGLAAELDDDGNAAQGHKPKQGSTPTKKAPAAMGSVGNIKVRL